jgi:hypothetical protein
MVESELPACIHPGARQFKEIEGALDVGINEGGRPDDRPIDMRLRGKVDDTVNIVGRETGLQAREIADVDLFEPIIAMFLDSGGVGQIAGISQRIDIYEKILRVFGNHVKQEVASDEPGPSRYSYSFTEFIYIIHNHKTIILQPREYNLVRISWQ